MLNISVGFYEVNQNAIIMGERKTQRTYLCNERIKAVLEVGPQYQNFYLLLFGVNFSCELALIIKALNKLHHPGGTVLCTLVFACLLFSYGD